MLKGKQHRGLNINVCSNINNNRLKEGPLDSSSDGFNYNAAYFHAYSDAGIHEEMIKDRVRTETYRAAIQEQKDLIEGKVVLDVGCGTGILSIFCALAGAKKVYAVDASEIAVQAREIVKANNLSDKITVIIGTVEEVDIDEEVDVIVSEWMGYMLLYESMLASVITARDRWLKPGGLILPSHATDVYLFQFDTVGLLQLYIVAITHPQRYDESIDFWRNVYGIDMSAMIPLAKQCAFEEPCIEIISGENVLTWPTVVKEIDCNTVTVQDLESVAANFCMTSIMNASLHGFALWFDVTFGRPSSTSNEAQSESAVDNKISGDEIFQGSDSLTGRRKRVKLSNSIVLSTAPEKECTHWAQTVLYTYDPIDVKQDQVIEGSIRLSQCKENPRFLNINLQYASGGRNFVKESKLC